MTDGTMGNQQATQAEIGWLAGIIDGEGHLGISTQNKARGESVKFDLQIVNTDYALIEKVVRVLRAVDVNPLVRERVHIKATWNTNKIVTVGKMAHIKRVIDLTVDQLTGVKHDKAILMRALIESRMTKTRADKYSDHEWSLVHQFRSAFIGRCGASTTAREAYRAPAPVTKIQSVLA